MKKNLFFYALFALLCVFFLKVGIAHATDSWLVYGDGWSGLAEDTYLSPDGAYNVYTSVSTNCYISVVNYIDNTNHWHIGSNFWDTGGNYHQYINLTTKLSGKTAGDYTLYCISGEYVYFHWTGTAIDVMYDPPPPSANITISSPNTGTTITTTATHIVGTWANIDTDLYGNLTIYFSSNFIREQSPTIIIPLTGGSGSFDYPLSSFGISANGQWNLKGNTTYKNTQLSDMYITTDLISPVGYNLIFDVSGFHTPYTFTDFDTWYGTNVANYDTPSAWASGMIGYIQPILEKVAEFGARIQDYLDTSTAHQRGYAIGSVFPVINAYILKINIFFGGFPIVQFFQYGILIMIGIFAVKTILKLLAFIPFVGGGG